MTIHCWREQLVRKNLKRFRGGLVCEAHRLLYHSTLGLSNRQESRRRCCEVTGGDTALVDSSYRIEALAIDALGQHSNARS